jgi:hypothetical protein
MNVPRPAVQPRAISVGEIARVSPTWPQARRAYVMLQSLAEAVFLIRPGSARIGALAAAAVGPGPTVPAALPVPRPSTVKNCG